MNKKLFIMCALYFFNVNSGIEYFFIKILSDVILSYTKNVHINQLAVTPPSPAAARPNNQNLENNSPARPGSNNNTAAPAATTKINYKELENYLFQKFKNIGESKRKNCSTYNDYYMITNECKNSQNEFSLYHVLYQYTKNKKISSSDISLIETMMINEIHDLEERINRDYELFLKLENERWSSDLHVSGHNEFRHEFKENKKQLEWLRKTYKTIFNKTA